MGQRLEAGNRDETWGIKREDGGSNWDKPLNSAMAMRTVGDTMRCVHNGNQERTSFKRTPANNRRTPAPVSWIVARPLTLQFTKN